MDELIRKQDALDAIHCNITVTGRQNAELVAATIGTFADRIKALPPVQPEMTDEQFKDYCRKRCLSVVTNEFMYEVRKMVPTVQPAIVRSIGKLVGYTDKPCPNCGRLRVERYESGLEICEKCNWCEQTKSYWLDGV